MADQPEPCAEGSDLERLIQKYQDALESGRVDEAEATVAELLAQMAAASAAAPSPERKLLDEVVGLEATGDWAGAEGIYHRLAALARAENNDLALSRAHQGLTALLAMLDRNEAALEAARAWLEVARRADISPLLFSALEAVARCNLRLGRPEEALAAVEEILGRISAEAMYDLHRGRAFTLRAECYCRAREPGRAADDLETARPFLEKIAAVACAAGAQAGLVHWWAIRAKVNEQLGDGAGAMVAWEEAVALCRRVHEMPHVSSPYTQNALARYLNDFGQTLHALGQRERAEEMLAESRALRQELGLPPVAQGGQVQGESKQPG
jgi:tetratricopeptide (TPR) repeat protein